jgi:NAD(P)-dependent dehydrogenase (short-subunit alcohol dehydrogenase family)
MAVIIVDISRHAGDATTRSIMAKRGRAATEVADLGEPEASETAIAAALELFGRIDVLVNNARVYRPAGRLPDIHWDLFERTALVMNCPTEVAHRLS